MAETEYKTSWNGSRGGKNRGGKNRNRGRYFGQGNTMGGNGYGPRSQNMEAGGSSDGNFDFNQGFYDRSSQFGDMMYSGNMNQMPRNQWEVSYPINTRYMGYRPDNTDYSYFGPYNNPSNDYGNYRGMNATNFDYSNNFSDGYDMSQDYGYNADFGFNNYNDTFHMPSRPGGGPFHSRRGNFPHRGRGRGRFSRTPKQFHANRQGKKKKKKSQDSAAPKHVFAKKPWFDDAILKLLKEKIRAHKRMKRSPSKSNIEAFKELRKEVRRISRQSYNDYCLKSGLPNKYLEAAKAKRQKAEEAASKPEDDSIPVISEQGEENGHSSNNNIDQNENSTNERSEQETQLAEVVNDEGDDANRSEQENTVIVKDNTVQEGDQEDNNRLETELTNGSEEVNQNMNNSLHEEKTVEEESTEEFVNIRPDDNSVCENENIEELKEQIITRQTMETDSADVKMENNLNASPEDNFVEERTSNETSLVS
ncbi:uncharacterized protein LOC111632790 [Centruroides sculpturatus]|uniref:uncharacterized protein LOC111632790 n=1 Tax=Centruroides sculpturatus TaxID=218467 RepID=UPI000C6E38B5|nr:uncharacterized protein LOC111632790 [Centruroides sculpturatus]